MTAAYFCMSILVFLVASRLCGSVGVNGKQMPAALIVKKSALADKRVCQSDEPCYFGYVRAERGYASATYRALQSWSVFIVGSIEFFSVLSFVTRTVYEKRRFTFYFLFASRL